MKKLLCGFLVLFFVILVWVKASSAPAAAPPPPVVLTPISPYKPLLPGSRIIAYYGNFYSPRMGVLGQYPPDQVMQKLLATAQEWAVADPKTTVIPAIAYITVAAQNNPGKDGKYRLRMPAAQIEKAISMADQIHGLVFLEIQVGLSDVQTEVPLLEPYLKLPNVELDLDPEFAMHGKEVPGSKIGTMDAADINYVVEYLAGIVQTNHIPPKILVVHRFTNNMLTNYKNIKPLPEVQIVIDMDGFGRPGLKTTMYREVIEKKPVQYTGFKLFYKNDAVAGHLMTPSEVLYLRPQPSYIQYQ